MACSPKIMFDKLKMFLIFIIYYFIVFDETSLSQCKYSTTSDQMGATEIHIIQNIQGMDGTFQAVVILSQFLCIVLFLFSRMRWCHIHILTSMFLPLHIT